MISSLCAFISALCVCIILETPDLLFFLLLILLKHTQNNNLVTIVKQSTMMPYISPEKLQKLYPTKRVAAPPNDTNEMKKKIIKK
jgi:hypothetical protein